MGRWIPIALTEKLFLNAKAAMLTRGSAALENAYQNELGGISRFPGLASFATLGGNADTYLHEWKGDLIAVSSSRVWRVKQDGTTVEVTGAPVSGFGRVIFDKTPDELLMAAGGQIIRLAAAQTEILSPDAPLSTHVGYIGGYAVAIESNTGLFYNSGPNEFRTWNPIDVFAADSRPDFLNAMLITPYQEMLLSGPDSLEQFDRLPAGSTAPFARRWGIGAGVFAPYTLTFIDNTAWCVNSYREFVRVSAQSAIPISDDIRGNVLEPADDWDGAWAAPMLLAGQKFVLLQLPKATNAYGTKGITLLYNYRQQKWFSLFGWDDASHGPTGWNGTSYYSLWGRHFVGGKGVIYELKNDTYQNDGKVQRVVWRSGHLDQGEARMDNLSVRLKRGLANSNSDRHLISVRVLLGGRTWTKWRRQDLGRFGENEMWVDFGMIGCASTFQIEIDMTDAAEFELVRAKALLTPLG
jgi:hypothetical protein